MSLRLLICTQTLDKVDPNLGFFHRWVEEFAKHCQSVVVICLKEGTHSLPANVRVYSLGKERGTPRLMRWWRALRYIVVLRNGYDAVFVHMNPEYLLLGGLLWRAWGKKAGLWYTHKKVNLKLRVAVMFANVVWTASAESFRLKSKKLRVMGHGIDISIFAAGDKSPVSELRIVTAGRITPAKHLLEMLAAMDVLYARGMQFRFTIIGAPGAPADRAYEEALVDAIARKQYRTSVRLLGPVAYEQLPTALREERIFLNLSTTGSLDKAVLDAFAAGLTAVTSNEAFKAILEPLGLFVAYPQPLALADALVRASQTDPTPLIALVRERHSLQKLVPGIIESLA